jgi:hypothetical protein
MFVLNLNPYYGTPNCVTWEPKVRSLQTATSRPANSLTLGSLAMQGKLGYNMQQLGTNNINTWSTFKCERLQCGLKPAATMVAVQWWCSLHMINPAQKPIRAKV